MNFHDFQIRIEELASKEDDNLREIQALITCYFKNKVIPHLDSIQTFLVRCSSNDPGEVFKNSSRCSYNPNPENIPLQRCNYPKQQVFYCSMFSDTDFANTSLTCLVETSWEKVEDHQISRAYFTLSRWQTKRPLKLWILPFSDVSCDKNRDFKIIRNNMEKLVKGNFDDSVNILKSLEYMSAVFCSRENKKEYYKISSAFYNSLLFYEKFMNAAYDGLIYPSANTDGSGMNVVLKKDLVDANVIVCDLAMMYSMQRAPNDNKYLSYFPASNISFTDDCGNLKFNTVL